MGLRHVGSARSAVEATRPALFDVRGTRVALLAYAYGLNGTATGTRERWRVNLINAPRILRDAAAARRGGADLVVVALHWGTEYAVQPTAAQQAVTRKLLASNDIDLIYGHHAHVVQPVERINGRWVIYGLGNSVAAQAAKRVQTQEGLLVQVQFVRNAAGHWSSPKLRWVPSFTASRQPCRWADLRLKGSGYQDSRRRIADVVTSRGAAEDGASELPLPVG